ncbi:MAG: ArsR/SmtB family transcription factor [Bacilli bacterium]
MIQILDEQIYELSSFYKIFGDPTRLKILIELVESEKTVSTLVENLGMSQSVISHQLKVLRDHRIVKNERKDKYVIYSLDDNHVLSTLTQGIEHIMHG